MNTRYGSLNGVTYYAVNDKFVTFKRGVTSALVLSFDDWKANGVKAIERAAQCNQELRKQTAEQILKIIKG